MTESADDALVTAVASRDPDGVRAAIQDGASPSAKLGAGSVLHIASLAGPLDVVKMLLEAGADVNSRGEGNETPLHFASCGRGDEAVAIVRHLMSCGADVNATDRKGQTPLDLAAGKRIRATALVLSDGGAECAPVNKPWVRRLVQRHQGRAD
jgi:ankyrin repeat protein